MPSQKRRSRSGSQKEHHVTDRDVPARVTMADRLTRQRLPLALAGILIAATILVYAQACRFGFVLIDDPTYVSENPRVQGGLSLENIAWSWTTFRDGNWIPLTWLSLMLDTTVFGFHAAGYHLTNILLHAANTGLVFAFLARATGNPMRSACVAALFALHPLHVESVAWITERKDVLSTLFGLLALLSYVNYAVGRGRWNFAACVLCFVASLLSKQTFVTLPFVLLLLDYWPLGRLSERSARLWLIVEKSPLFAISAVACTITVIAQRSGHNVASLSASPFLIRCLNAVVVYATYVAKTFVPYHLSVFYPHPGEHYFVLTVVVSAVLVTAISAAAVVLIRRRPYLFVGWAWYLGTLVPMIGLVQVGRQQMADRYTYLPLVGVFLASVWLFADFIPLRLRGRHALASVAVTVIVLCAGATFVQASYWQDSITLFRHAYECDAQNPIAASALGSRLVETGQTADGLALLESAVRLAPQDAECHFNLAVSLEKAGQSDAALKQYEMALALDDWDPRAHTNLARMLWKRNHVQEAKQHFLKAIAIDPEHVSAYVNLAALCGQTADFAGTITYSQRALQLDPTLSICHYNLALALRAEGRLDDAIRHFRDVLNLSPNDPDATRELTRTLAMRGGS
jgi:protein O-mannosyl-transferase